MSWSEPLDRPRTTGMMDVSASTTAGGHSGRTASPRVASHPAAVTERLGQMRASPPGQPIPLPTIPPPSIPVPDLRTRPPAPVVPWPLRAKHWLRDRTQPGRLEAEHDARIADFMALMSTGCHILATIGPKGGPGKTTVALTTGLVLAEVPLARPIVVELNPDWGTIDHSSVAPTRRRSRTCCITSRR